MSITNLDLFQDLLKNKINIGFDIHEYQKKEEELLVLLKFLCDKGYENKIILSSGVKFKVHLLRWLINSNI